MEKDFYKIAPSSCGVYIMKDDRGNVIYVGKAKNIKKRLSSYFRKSEGRYQVEFLLRKLAQIDYILTNSEKEALILENNLIKKYTPKYNIQLKDDKNYLCIKIDTKKDFPKIEFVRKIDDKDALYFGPYPSAKIVRDVIINLQRLFPLRHCSDRTFQQKKKPCLYFHMGECIAPCINKEKKDIYNGILRDVIQFLKGKVTKKIINTLKKEMENAAERQDFERAAFIRDTIFKAKKILEQQGVETFALKDIDVIGTFIVNENINVSMLYVRAGKLLSKRNFTIPQGLSIEDTLESFLLNFYQKAVVIPDEIIVGTKMANKKELELAIKEITGKTVYIKNPYNDNTKNMLSMANLNAASFNPVISDAVTLMQEIFKLPEKPNRIECFDATHLYGKLNLCAMSVYQDGELAKKEYRIFNIHKEGFDDYKALYEALLRRFSHKEWQFPEILVIDGGKGQLACAKKVLSELKIDKVYPIAISKDEKNSIYIGDRKNPIILKSNNEALKLLILLREEAHRFANVHLKKRLKKSLP